MQRTFPLIWTCVLFKYMFAVALPTLCVFDVFGCRKVTRVFFFVNTKEKVELVVFVAIPALR